MWLTYRPREEVVAKKASAPPRTGAAASSAASSAARNAMMFKDTVERKMTPEQIAEAQKLARECIKKNYKDCG